MLRKHLAIITFTLAGLLPLQAEEKAADHPLKPLLWKVEGGELKEPSWLFGTIHLGREPAAKLHPLAAKAMEASDVFYTEIDMDPRKQLALAMKFMRKDGKKLTESIGEELTKQLDAELKAINPQLNSKAFDPMKTWAVYVTLPLLKEQIAGRVALEPGQGGRQGPGRHRNRRQPNPGFRELQRGRTDRDARRDHQAAARKPARREGSL